ncbi:oxidoreductase [Aureococcus anophagefferens]|nr:oxidoreductase [Aureococcus anophagefferens]
MIARPSMSRNEWKATEIGAFEVGNVALGSRPGRPPRGARLALVPPLSLPVAYGSQQGMLLGLTLPLRALFLPRAGAPLPRRWPRRGRRAPRPAVLGLEVARRADAALAAFAATRKPGDVLDAGLWRASRHPNHLGEQLFWVGFAGLALAHRGAWDPCCLGFLLNHVPDTLATLPLIDARMASDTKRVRNFLKYEAAVPLIYPTPASIARAFRGAKAD